MSKADNSARDMVLATRVAAGETMASIADSLGISLSRVSQIAGDACMREMIDLQRRRIIIEAGEQAIDNIVDIIRSEDKADKVLKLKYSARVAESMGVLPAYAPPPPIVAQLYNVQVNVGIDQAVNNALKHLDCNIIDVDSEPLD